MADCHDLFATYLDDTRLSSAKKKDLRRSRNANRRRIKTYFRETLKRPVPKFKGQGSYRMKSMIRPLEDRFDIDDGAYLQGLGTDESTWPTAEEVHQWIIDAVSGYTDAEPEDKTSCVRVIYKGKNPTDSGYHIDIPCYARDANGIPKLFVLGQKETVHSDPGELTKWFCKKVEHIGEQVRNLVIDLKGWRDFQQGGAAVASGLALTLLVVEHYVADLRDDVALVKTVEGIVTHLEGGGKVQKPVAPFDDVSEKWTVDERNALIEKLRTLRSLGQDALDEEDRSAASKIWSSLLGPRFPEVEPDDDGGSKGAPAIISTRSPAVRGHDGRSA